MAQKCLSHVRLSPSHYFRSKILLNGWELCPITEIPHTKTEEFMISRPCSMAQCDGTDSSVPLIVRSQQATGTVNVGRRQYDYMHFARAFLLSLGLLLHGSWFCRSHGFKVLFDLIHSFRMESFFLIAGIFSAHTLCRVSPVKFLLRRSERLGIPLLFCTLTLTFLGHLLPPIVVAKECFPVDLAGHLWFLRTLLLLVLTLFLLHLVWPEIDQRIKLLRVKPLVFLFALVGIQYFALHLNNLLVTHIWHSSYLLGDLVNTINYAPWLAGGYILFHHGELLEKLIDSLPFNVCNVAAFLLLKPLLERSGAVLHLVLAWHGVYILSICGLLFGLSRRFSSNPHPCVRSLSDASYTIYLLHLPIMALLCEFPLSRQAPNLTT
jgi:glucan biosynthesis protein C